MQYYDHTIEQRERDLDEALQECLERGVARKFLEVLVRESGARWKVPLPVDSSVKRIHT